MFERGLVEGARFLVNHGQHQGGGMLLVVKNCVCGGDEAAPDVDCLACIQIPVESREIAA